MLKEGERAPRFRLDQVDGDPIGVEDVLQGGRRPLLVFLRYLG